MAYRRESISEMDYAEISIDLDGDHSQKNSPKYLGEFLQILNPGGLGGIRTRDQKIKSLLLYQLSYQSKITILQIWCGKYSEYYQKSKFFVYFLRS